MSTQEVPKERDWYSVRVSALRQIMTVILAFAALGAAFVGYQQLDAYLEQRNALKSIQDASEQAQRLEALPDGAERRVQNRDAYVLLEDAKQQYDGGKYGQALETATLAYQRFVLALASAEGNEGTILVTKVEGSVEWRRGERGAWRRARTNQTLNPGDWVKTSAGSTAEILYSDDTTFSLSSGTMINLGGSQTASGGSTSDGASTSLAFGEVGLETQSPSTVNTPGAQAKVSSKTTAFLAYDRDEDAARFAVAGGEVAVKSTSSGQERVLKNQETVDMQSGSLGDVRDWLPGPALNGPSDELEIDLDRNEETRLSWRGVPGAQGYVLTVSSTAGFGTKIIENERSRTNARLGLKGEGQFYWKVAAIDAMGARGNWSDSRSFRVAALGAGQEIADDTPPELQILSTETYGRRVLVRGYAEPGSKVTINSEHVDLKSDGTFLKAVRMNRAGWDFLEIVAADVWDNSTEERKRVFVDAL